MQWLESTNGQSGVVGSDYSRLGMQDRLQQGRVGEDFIISQLSNYGVAIRPTRDYDTDARQKIDGYMGKSPIQIKLRKSGTGSQNDIAFEVCRNHRDDEPLVDQLKDIHQQGRDFRGKVEFYFVMNRDESEIYQINAAKLKSAVIQAIKEMKSSTLHQGILHKPFTSSSGVQLRPTRDNDPKSFTPFKVMAFVPVQSLPVEKYPIQNTATPLASEPKAQPKVGPQINQNWIKAMDDAFANGTASFPAPNNKKLLKPFQRFATKKGLSVTISGGQVVLKKAT